MNFGDIDHFWWLEMYCTVPLLFGRFSYRWLDVIVQIEPSCDVKIVTKDSQKYTFTHTKRKSTNLCPYFLSILLFCRLTPCVESILQDVCMQSFSILRSNELFFSPYASSGRKHLSYTKNVIDWIKQLQALFLFKNFLGKIS